MREKVKQPKDWRLLSIASLADNNKELFDDGDWVEAEYLTESGIRLIQTGNIGEGTFVDKDKKKYISEQSFTKLKCKELTVGDILICRLADPAGRACILPNIGEEKMITSVDVSIFRPKLDYVDRGFLVASMSTSNWFNEIRERCGGSTRTRIARSELGKMKIPLPPLPEQKAIAKVLHTADAAIHTIEKLIAQKELRKKWLMQQLLTGKKRLKGFSGEWKKERLEKYLVKHDEKSTVNNQYPVLTSSRRGIFLQSNYYTRDVASEDNTGYNVVPRGYFTYRHMSDDLIFKFNINDIVDRGIVSTLYPVFTTKDINSYFLLTKLNEGSEFKMHAEEQKQGGSRTYVYFKTLCQLKLNLPSLEEQTAITQVLQAADKEINLFKAKAKKLREQKKGLMQVLLTGKKRLTI